MRDTAERRGLTRPLLAAALLGTLAAGLVASARAETKSPRHEAQLDATVRFLQEDQNADGGFGGEAGGPSDPDISAWVALALTAADVNPRDQAKPGGTSAYEYLAAHAGELTSTTDFERALLVVDATESPPRPFGGVDLVATILDRQLPDGAFPHEAGSTRPGMNDTVFAILALSPIKEPPVEAAVRRAAEFVIAEQDEDGSWPSWCPKSACEEWVGNTDVTGAAIEALVAAGMPGTEAQAKALAYLRETQLPDGGWPQSKLEGESNVGSTAWVVQGIWAAGENPETWRTGAGGSSEEPLDYLTSMQQPDGHVRYMGSREMNGVWMTSYVTPALAGRTLPIVPPPAVVGPPPVLPTSGEAGTGTTAGGVGAGGGGNGAPLFSRPKNESKGKTPGGARQTHVAKNPAPDHGRNRRGSSRHQPTGTETAEPGLSPEADQEVGSVGPTAPSTPPPASGDGGGGADRGGRKGPGDDGAPLRASAATPADGAPGDEVEGIVIGAPEGRRGDLAPGAPGLKSAEIGSGDQTWPALAIGVAAALAALAGAALERRRAAGVTA